GPITEVRNYADASGLGSIIDSLDNPGSVGSSGLAWHPDSDHLFFGNNTASRCGAYPFDGATIGTLITCPQGVVGASWNAAGDKALGVDLNDVGRVYTFVKSPGSLSLLDSDS
ncbi:hypothetical protein, partial [Tritonibacter sp. SIMBA_163]|uniref:hypothetical protein n=1 Tax=Tritonibacter sp. SIMBA_163 TaxID=3080868 RepID=UPI0039810D03